MTGPCSIRLFAESDHSDVVALWQGVFAYPEPRNDPEFVIRQKLAFQPELFFVAEDSGRAIGTLLAGYDGHRGWGYHLAVEPAYRRQGIAAALIRHAEDALRSLGCVKINLQVLSGNARVVPYYESLGYQVEDRISMGKVILES